MALRESIIDLIKNGNSVEFEKSKLTNSMVRDIVKEAVDNNVEITIVFKKTEYGAEGILVRDISKKGGSLLKIKMIEE